MMTPTSVRLAPGSMLPLYDSFVSVRELPDISYFAHQMFDTLIFPSAVIVTSHESVAKLPLFVIFTSYW